MRSSGCHHERGGWERAGGNPFTSTGVGQLPLVGRDRCSLCFPFAATRYLVARHPPRLVMRTGSVALHTSMWALGFYPLANDFYFASTPPKVRYKILVYRKLGFFRNASCVCQHHLCATSIRGLHCQKQQHIKTENKKTKQFEPIIDCIFC